MAGEPGEDWNLDQTTKGAIHISLVPESGWSRPIVGTGEWVAPSNPWYRRVGGHIQSRRFCRAPSLITIGEAIPPPGISKVAENSPNPDRLS